MMFKVGDKVKVRPDYKIKNIELFSHDVVYEVFEIIGNISFKLKELGHRHCDSRDFVLADKKSVGFVIE